MKQDRRTLPRTVLGAVKKGWHVVTLPRTSLEKHGVSWLGLDIWATKQTQGHHVTSYSNRQFAFEKYEDASWFTMKWCL